MMTHSTLNTAKHAALLGLVLAFAAVASATITNTDMKGRFDTGNNQIIVPFQDFRYLTFPTTGAVLVPDTINALHAQVIASEVGSSASTFMCFTTANVTDALALACMQGKAPFDDPNAGNRYNSSRPASVSDTYIMTKPGYNIILAVFGRGLTTHDRNNYFSASIDARPVGPTDIPRIANKHLTNTIEPRDDAINTFRPNAAFEDYRVKPLGIQWTTVHPYKIAVKGDALISRMGFGANATPASFNVDVTLVDTGPTSPVSPTSYTLTLHSSLADAQTGANPLASKSGGAPIMELDASGLSAPATTDAVYVRVELTSDTSDRDVQVMGVLTPTVPTPPPASG